MITRLRDRRRLAQFKAEQRAKRRQQPSPSEASWDDDADAPVKSALWAGLTWRQARQAQALLERTNRERGGLTGPRYALRIAGIRGAVLSGAVGSPAWGRSMHGKRGGKVIALHGLDHLRRISPLGVRASVIARERRKARRQWKQAHGETPADPTGPSTPPDPPTPPAAPTVVRVLYGGEDRPPPGTWEF